MSPKKCCKKELNSAILYLKISLVLVQREKDHPVCFSPCFVKDAICLAAGRKKTREMHLFLFCCTKVEIQDRTSYYY